METKKVTDEMREQFLKAAEGMGATSGRQDLGAMGVKQFNLVDYFDTFFGEWKQEGTNILVHLHPRAGKADIWYDARYVDQGRRYVPGRREILPKGLCFPPQMEETVKAACNKVTFGDVELDFVKELGAWAIRFCDVESYNDWVNEGGFLEQFFIAVDDGIDKGE